MSSASGELRNPCDAVLGSFLTRVCGDVGSVPDGLGDGAQAVLDGAIC